MTLPMLPLDQALRTASPRYSVPPTPAASWLIHAGALLLLLVLLARAAVPNNLAAWSAGLVYVLYDTALLIFTFACTLPLLRATPAGTARPALAVPALAVPSLAVPSLAVPSLAVPSLAVPSLAVPSLAVPSLAVPSLAVIVAAYNEAAVLPATLACLLTQSDPPDAIVIVDDGSTDDTPAVLAPLLAAHPQRIRWLRLPHAGKAAAMNQALPQIEADVVMTVDADTRLAADAVGEMRRAFAANPRLVAATGILTPVCDPTVTGRFLQWFQTHEYLRNFLSRSAWATQDALLLISGAFAGFRRLPVLDVGGFDPNCLVEDYELIHRLRRASVIHGKGWTTAVLGRAHATTDAPATIGAFLRQRRRWFGGFLQTQFWYRDMVGNPAYGRLGTRMLPVKAADTLQPVYGLAAFALLVFYLLTGHWRVLLPAGGVIGAKILFDLAFYLWSVLLYRRWVGMSGTVRFHTALMAALIEPFSFQLLRHLGATLGWVSFLTGQMRWGRGSRAAMLPHIQPRVT